MWKRRGRKKANEWESDTLETYCRGKTENGKWYSRSSNSVSGFRLRPRFKKHIGLLITQFIWGKENLIDRSPQRNVVVLSYFCVLLPRSLSYKSDEGWTFLDRKNTVICLSCFFLQQHDSSLHSNPVILICTLDPLKRLTKTHGTGPYF